MKVYEINKKAGYDGAGLALARVENGIVVELSYLRDFSEYDGDEEFHDLEDWQFNKEVIAKKEEMKAILGMASSWQFIEY